MKPQRSSSASWTVSVLSTTTWPTRRSLSACSVGETRRRGDGHGLAFVGRLVLGRDVDNTVCVDVEGGLDVGNTLRRKWDINEVEIAKEPVVANELTLALVDLGLDGGLTVSGS